VLGAARDLAKQDKSNTLLISDALAKYCQLQNIPVEDQQFCYNIDTMHKDVSRLLALGASDERICKRIKSVNKNFCTSKSNSSRTETISKKMINRAKKGVIYF
jgi:hypothetical protein